MAFCRLFKFISAFGFCSEYSVCDLFEFVSALKFRGERAASCRSFKFRLCEFCDGWAALIKSLHSSKFAPSRSFGFTLFDSFSFVPACDSAPSRSFKFRLVRSLKFKLFGALVLKSASLGFVSFESTPACVFAALDKFSSTFAATLKFVSAPAASEKFDSASAAALRAAELACSDVAPGVPPESKF